MSGERDPLYGRVIYEKPTWIDHLIHFGCLPITLSQAVVSLAWLILGEAIRQAFREPDAKLPSVLIDDAFTVLADRMATHGFVREGKKRHLVRSRSGKSDRIGYSARKYNERGKRAEFSIWFSTTAPEPPIRITWRSGENVVEDPKTGEFSIVTELGNLRPFRFQTVIDLYPRFRRSARTNKAAKLAEELAIPWFRSKRI